MWIRPKTIPNFVSLQNSFSNKTKKHFSKPLSNTFVIPLQFSSVEVKPCRTAKRYLRPEEYFDSVLDCPSTCLDR